MALYCLLIHLWMTLFILYWKNLEYNNIYVRMLFLDYSCALHTIRVPSVSWKVMWTSVKSRQQIFLSQLESSAYVLFLSHCRPTLISLPQSIFLHASSSLPYARVLRFHGLMILLWQESQQLAAQTRGAVSCPRRPTRPLCWVPRAAGKPLFWNNSDHTGAYIYNRASMTAVDPRGNHQCALSLSEAEIWPAPDGHRPDWPDEFHVEIIDGLLSMPTLNWQSSCSHPVRGIPKKYTYMGTRW